MYKFIFKVVLHTTLLVLAIPLLMLITLLDFLTDDDYSATINKWYEEYERSKEI